MKKIEAEDELRPEYDLKSLQLRRVGSGRKGFGNLVRLEPDVMQVFPDAEAVNEALRALIAIARRSSLPVS
jgi:hypothetical protein